jgi:chaperonin GroES
MNCTDVDTNDLEVGNKKVKRLRPLGDRISVRVLPQVDEMVNGMYIPDTAKEKPQEGIVVEVGNGRVVNGERIPVDVKKGQQILFGKYAGNEVSYGGDKLLILQENEVQAVFEED